jgi:hypothetical protein
MSIFYLFYNKTKFYQQNQHELNENFCDFVSNFHLYTENEQKDVFEKCIKLNNWEITDTILAVPDNNDNNDKNDNYDKNNDKNIIYYINKNVKEQQEQPEQHSEINMFYYDYNKYDCELWNYIKIKNNDNECIFNRSNTFYDNIKSLSSIFIFQIEDKKQLYEFLLNKDNCMINEISKNYQIKNLQFPSIYIDVLNKIEKLENSKFPWNLECGFK